MTALTAERVSYVAFPQAGGEGLTVAGRLAVGEGGERAPAVLICHGSDGVDGRGAFHAAALNAAGFATLEIDMWAARGVARGAGARPSSPLKTLPDAFGALAFLAGQPEIDPARIAIMGFSWGGLVSLLSTVRTHLACHAPAGPGFAAHAAFYPVCWAFGAVPGLSLAGRTGAPVLLQTGEADAYDSAGAGQRLAQAMREDADGGPVEHHAYPGAGHGFDGDRPARVIQDPFAHEGRGGPVTMAFHPVAARAARARVLAFFLRALKPGAP